MNLESREMAKEGQKGKQKEREKITPGRKKIFSLLCLARARPGHFHPQNRNLRWDLKGGWMLGYARRRPAAPQGDIVVSQRRTGTRWAPITQLPRLHLASPASSPPHYYFDCFSSRGHYEHRFLIFPSQRHPWERCSHLAGVHLPFYGKSTTPGLRMHVNAAIWHF